MGVQIKRGSGTKSKPVWYGKLIDDYYINNKTDEFFNLDYKKVLKDNESASFSEKAFDEKEKIIWRQTAPYIKATIDFEKRWFRNTIQCAWIKPEYKDKIDLYYLLAVLNSNYLRMLYCEIVNEASGKVFPQVKLTHVKKLPIRIAKKDIQLKIRKLVEKILNKESSALSESIIKEIDELLANVYELSASEKKQVDAFRDAGLVKKKAS